MAVLIAAAIAADAVGVRLYQHQTGFVFVDRDRVPAQIALELRRVSRGQASAGGNGDRPARSRCFLRGHADACATVQCATDGDELILEQMHIVGVGALLVVLDDRRAGNVQRAIRATGHMHAAAVFRRRVARDLAAAHVECTYIHTHAAAAARLVVAADLAVAHGERAIVHTHAAAEGCRRVARDLAAAHGERAIVHIHAAAVFRLVVADLAAVQIECAGLVVAAHVHAAAPVLADVIDGLVVRDAAAVVQIKRAAAHIHAAAVAFAVAVYLRRVVRDAAAAHMKRAAAHVHAAAVAGSLGTARRLVVGDRAAVHINRAAGDLHAAALGRLVFSDAAAVQIECAAVDLHAAAPVGARDLALIAFAVRQGQLAAGYDLKHGLIFGCALDRPAVQADGDVALDLNGMLDRNIGVKAITRFQIIAAVGQNILTAHRVQPISTSFTTTAFSANIQCILTA